MPIIAGDLLTIEEHLSSRASLENIKSLQRDPHTTLEKIKNKREFFGGEGNVKVSASTI